ncbi:unnamed protein product [Meloidogyne enterolobii]|uniref:Uncharacterized protein n=1 Tax=Meloidogyne enterolobii TaxID=390850 RepID=A0ACB1A4C2_MELEN
MHATPSPIKKNGSFTKSPSRKSDHKNVGGQHKAKVELSSSKNDSRSPPHLRCLPQARVRHIMECSPGGEDLKMSEDGVIAMAKAAALLNYWHEEHMRKQLEYLSITIICQTMSILARNLILYKVGVNFNFLKFIFPKGRVGLTCLFG